MMELVYLFYLVIKSRISTNILKWRFLPIFLCFFLAQRKGFMHLPLNISNNLFTFGNDSNWQSRVLRYIEIIPLLFNIGLMQISFLYRV